MLSDMYQLQSSIQRDKLILSQFILYRKGSDIEIHYSGKANSVHGLGI